MTYLEEARELSTRYPYSYGVCEYAYLAHGDKAEELLKLCAERNIQGSDLMRLSDFIMRSPEITIPVSFLTYSPKVTKKESKLPKKFLKGWYE